MTVLERLSAFVCDASASRLAEAERDMLRRHTADMVVSRIAGTGTEEGRALSALYPASPDGNAAIPGLAATIRLTEVDDIHIESCTTPSSVSVPVALGLAAKAPVSEPDRLWSAIWIGTELVVRLGKAISGASVLYQGVWPTRTGAALGAAAVSCRMWGLDHDTTVRALSLALMMTPGRIGRFTGGLSGRWIVFAAAIADGIRAAEAARAGFSADPTLLDGPWLERTLGVPVDMSKLTSNLGERSIYPELTLKPFCTSRQALSATEAMRALVADGLDPGTIRKIRVRVPSAYAGMISAKLDPAVRASSYVSAAGQMAIAALSPEHLYDIDRTVIIADPRLAKLAALATVEADPSLDPLFPLKWPAIVEVETPSGTMTKRIDDAHGDPGRRLDDKALLAKAEVVLKHQGKQAQAARIMSLATAAVTDREACRTLATTFAKGEAA
jgi:2-methylcitrate dehydratase PrpD